jgi:biotin transport system ATP-binding protein
VQVELQDRRKAPLDLAAGVRLSGVTLRRGGRSVLEGLDLDLTERRIGLIGVNGSGKSSLVRLLNGLLKAGAGEITLFGRSLSEKGFRPARHVGFIFQNPDHQILFPTVAEELSFGLDQLGLPKAEARERAFALLEREGIAGWAERAVQELSEGQKQLVCVLAVLIMEPALLILDEPFSSLDLPTRRQIMGFLEKRPEMQILISHDMESFEGFDRVIWLDQGKVAGDGPPGEVIAAYKAAMDSRRGEL